MSVPSKASIRLFKAVEQAEKELRRLNDELRPLHERMIRQQDKTREAYNRMNLSFADDGLDPAKAFEMCRDQQEDTDDEW